MYHPRANHIRTVYLAAACLVRRSMFLHVAPDAKLLRANVVRKVLGLRSFLGQLQLSADISGTRRLPLPRLLLTQVPLVRVPARCLRLGTCVSRSPVRCLRLRQAPRLLRSRP